jgi:hypothetical protein
MSQNTDSTEAKYELFIEKVSTSQLVWGLKNKEGWANSHSAEDEEITVVPFWHDKALAKACAKYEWKGYLPVMVPLSEFLESWCLGMAEIDSLAGINWDAKMLGNVAGPLDVAIDILEQLKTNGTAIKFLNYESIDSFITEIQASTE